MDDLPWLIKAKEYLGKSEGAGALDNPEIVMLYTLAGHPEVKHDSVPWCAAFVGATLRQSGIRGTGSLAARSYEQWGIKLQGPIYGCIGVKKRAGSGWEGHVGYVVGANQGTIFLLAGNQNDMVSVEGFPRSTFTAFRWPEGVKIAVRNLPVNLVAARTIARET